MVCNVYKDCFLRNVEAYGNVISKAVDNFAKDLKTDFRTMHVKTVTEGYTGERPNYFTEAMFDIYAKAAAATAPRGTSSFYPPSPFLWFYRQYK